MLYNFQENERPYPKNVIVGQAINVNIIFQENERPYPKNAIVSQEINVSKKMRGPTSKMS